MKEDAKDTEPQPVTASGDTAAIIMDSIAEEYQTDAVNTGILPEKIINPVDGSEMIKIPAGKFIFGVKKKSRDSLLKVMNNAPLDIFELEHDRKVISLPAYYIDKLEITNEQFQRFIRAGSHRAPAGWSEKNAEKSPRYPVTGIGWNDARAYAAWAGKRLPSEEEWEKAARGTDGRMWPWGNDPDGEKYNGNFQGNYRPVNVGSFPQGASPYGVQDMAGNVYEMTTGKWGEESNAMRGGSFLNAGSYTRTMFRWAPGDTINGASWLGFRCVMDSAEAVKLLKSSN